MEETGANSLRMVSERLEVANVIGRSVVVSSNNNERCGCVCFSIEQWVCSHADYTTNVYFGMHGPPHLSTVTCAWGNAAEVALDIYLYTTCHREKLKSLYCTLQT